MSRLHSRPEVTLFALCASLVFGCAGNQKLARMNSNLPIETEHGYQQGGSELDPKDMKDKLRTEPESASHVQRAEVLGMLAIVLAAAGGGLVGWPLGDKAAGEEHPNWELAYAGGGAIAVSIPLAIWSGDSLNRAVKAHNRSLNEPVAWRGNACVAGTRPVGAVLLSW